MMNKLLIVSLMAGVALLATNPAQAQTRIKKDSLEKTQWHHAPREFQIIDDRPVIRDFREAPSEAGSIEIPPGPQASGGVAASHVRYRRLTRCRGGRASRRAGFCVVQAFQPALP